MFVHPLVSILSFSRSLLSLISLFCHVESLAGGFHVFLYRLLFDHRIFIHSSSGLAASPLSRLCFRLSPRVGFSPLLRVVLFFSLPLEDARRTLRDGRWEMRVRGMGDGLGRAAATVPRQTRKHTRFQRIVRYSRIAVLKYAALYSTIIAHGLIFVGGFSSCGNGNGRHKHTWTLLSAKTCILKAIF